MSNTRWGLTLDARGFKHGPKREGTDDGHATVQESSAASRPCVWVRVYEEEQGEASVHLTVKQAIRFAEDILRVCNNHYMEQEER